VLAAVAVLAAAAVVLAVAACAAGGSQEDQDAIRAVYFELEEAWNEGDAGRFAGFFTDGGLRATYGVSRDEFVAGDNPLGFVRLDIAIVDFENVGDDEATVLIELVSGSLEVVERQRDHLVEQDGRWRIDRTESGLDVPLPSGVQPLGVEMFDFGYRFDPAEAGQGPRALRLENTGAQEHEAVLLTVPAGISLPQAVAAIDTARDPSQLPAGYAFAGVGFAAPDEERTIVLRNPMRAGHYLMICFIPDGGGGPPHYERGMVADFTVA
jgi:hypothetical protein